MTKGLVFSGLCTYYCSLLMCTDIYLGIRNK